ncbi:MAG: protein-glutamate methylesterase/protein-glutamine glutaminase [Thermodesulfobacteriota bacterium]
MSIKVLVVDDSIFYRKIVSDILKDMPDVEVVGTANNGKVAMNRIKSLAPDLVTLDVEMPEMNGLEVLQEIQKQGLDTDCLMISSLTTKGGEIAVQALSLGALDAISKPDQGDNEANTRQLKKDIEPKIRAFARKLELKALQEGRAPPQKSTVQPQEVEEYRERSTRSQFLQKRREKSRVVAIGVSTGGPNALSRLVPELDPKLNVPVFIVQHMPKVFTASLASALNAKSSLEVKEASDGEMVRSNCVYIAPGGYQMKVASGAGGEKIVRITDDPPENNCKPSVDYLFRSIAREYGSKATGVVMTGMGSDGKLGLQVMKAAGGVGIAQNASTCVVYGMPKEVVDAGLADVVSPLEEIAGEIAGTV